MRVGMSTDARERQMKHSKKWGVQAKILLVFTAINILATAAYTLFVYQIKTDSIYEATDARLTAAAHAVTRMLPADYLEQPLNTAPPANYLQQTRSLYAYSQEAGLRYVYAFVEDHGQVRYLADSASADEIRRLDDVVDSLYKQVKFYLTQVSRTPMGERESRKWTDIISFTINLEQVGDIIEKSANDVVSKNIERNRNFSDAGRQELCDLHARLVANLRLAMNVFINNDVNDAEKLLAEKVKFRELELVNYDKHLVRLADHTVQSIETSSLHLDLMRDLKRINSHFCSVAYPILEAAGALSESRLRAVEHERGDVTITGGGRQRV